VEGEREGGRNAKPIMVHPGLCVGIDTLDEYGANRRNGMFVSWRKSTGSMPWI
jgi:hypothetical protein